MFNISLEKERSSSTSCRCLGCGGTLCSSEEINAQQNAENGSTHGGSGGSQYSRSETFTIKSQRCFDSATNDATKCDIRCRENNVVDVGKFKSLLEWFESQLHIEMFLQSEMFENRIKEIEAKIEKIHPYKMAKYQIVQTDKDVDNECQRTSKSTQTSEIDSRQGIEYGRSQNARIDSSATDETIEKLSNTNNPFLLTPIVSSKKVYWKEHDDHSTKASDETLKQAPTCQCDFNGQEILRHLSLLSRQVDFIKDGLGQYDRGMSKFLSSLKLMDQAIFHTSNEITKLRSEQGQFLEGLTSLINKKLGFLEEIGPQYNTALGDMEVSIKALGDDLRENKKQLISADLTIEAIEQWKQTVESRLSSLEESRSSVLVSSRKSPFTDDLKMAARKVSPIRQINNATNERTNCLESAKPKSQLSRSDSTSHLYERKRELEAKMSRVPLRERRLYEQLANELELVDKQLARQRLKIRNSQK